MTDKNRAIIGLSIGELNQFVKLAEQRCSQDDDLLERDAQRELHRGKNVGKEWTSVYEQIQARADKMFGIDMRHKVNGQIKMKKKAYLDKRHKEFMQRYIYDHSTDARKDRRALLKTLHTMQYHIKFPALATAKSERLVITR